MFVIVNFGDCEKMAMCLGLIKKDGNYDNKSG